MGFQTSPMLSVICILLAAGGINTKPNTDLTGWESPSHTLTKSGLVKNKKQKIKRRIKQSIKAPFDAPCP